MPSQNEQFIFQPVGFTDTQYHCITSCEVVEPSFERKWLSFAWQQHKNFRNIQKQHPLYTAEIILKILPIPKPRLDV